MENHKDDSMNGVESMMEGNKTARRNSDMFLRIIAFIFTLVSSIVLGADKQTKFVSVLISPNLPMLNVPVVAKWNYLSAFMYFVVINAIACSYSALSLLLSFTVRSKKGNLSLIITILDILMVALLFSSIGAAGAIGIMGFEGNSHVQWNKVCNVFGKFCHQAAIALGMSLLGSVAFIFLTALAALNLNKNC